MLNWSRDRAWWPNASKSRFLERPGIRWHVQTGGEVGPSVLFIHGSGASTHSWAGVLEKLPEAIGWLALDLPGHGFSRADGREQPTGPEGIARAIELLLAEMEIRPSVIVGHSAGAAIGVSLAESIGARAVLAIAPSFTGALQSPVGRAAAEVVGPLVRSTFAAHFAAALSRRTSWTDSLLSGTGSDVPEWSRRCYRALVADPDHTAAVLRLFSRWSPDRVVSALPDFAPELSVLIGVDDAWIPEADVRAATRRVERCEVRSIAGGHLAHEERPALVVDHLTALHQRIAG